MTTKLPEIEDFFVAQLAEWPLAAGNFAALNNVEVKQFDLDGWQIKVQFNPARIVSSGAKVDAASLKARKCFLCEANRPAEQRGIDWNQYVILINPFPIFPRHLTIPDTSHTDQLIDRRIADMIQLSELLKGYTLFYNGPKCGASAPDHMHFQAGNSDFLTIFDALDNSPARVILNQGKTTLSLIDSLPLKVFLIETDNSEDGARCFERLYKALPVTDGENESMMNILCRTEENGRTRLVIIPRKRHRPSFYGTEGEDKMLLSPASVDMGGVFITPRREDFEKLDASIVRKVFEELCLSTEEINKIASNVK